MKKLTLSCFTVLVILTGCVSTRTYQTKADESETRRAKLDSAIGELEGERTAHLKLKKELADLTASKEKDAASLREHIDELSNRGIMTSKEIEDLKKERDRLSASDKEKTAKENEVVALKGQMEEINGKLARISKELEDVKKERDGLMASDIAKGEEIAAKAKEGEYLNREIERLKIKTGELSSEKEKELANIKSTYENLVKEMKKEIEKGDIKITQAVDRLSVNMVEKILFDSGRAEVKLDGLKVIKRVGDILKGITDKQIRVEGHTDNVPIGAKIRDKYQTNWELSTARATNIVRYLNEKVGVNPLLLSAAGMADNKPVASNDTLEGKAQNRRIEIVLLPLDVDRVLQELKK
ncbi:MAG: OmpA family protein [Deltaproteobacteria bacterium]|nr:OmpA family protein [Deltaproteobacteria bacterium]